MNIPIWLMWTVATLIAIMPLVILPLAMKVDKVCPRKETCNPAQIIAGVSMGFIDIEEMELFVIAHMMADVQMRQYWDKDIDYIV